VDDHRRHLQSSALRLEYLTIAWNAGEAALTVALGVLASSLALIGFGADSVIEVFASVVVVWHILPGHPVDDPVRTARGLRLVAAAFGVLSVVLAAAAISDLATARQADPSPLGIGYLAVTAIVMFGLARSKSRLAERLGSAPLRAEAAMTFLDGLLAVGTLIGLAMNAFAGWWWADPAAAVLISLAAARESKESWEEATKH